ncbi:MAG: 5'/3'-nucleotidase SurE, partial [Cyanobacteria bacterium J083]
MNQAVLHQKKPLNILISNDDGVFALGIRTLANTLAEAGHQVTVVCPDRERSAAGHGLTIHQPIRAELVDQIFYPQVTAWACSGTPADCVKFALSGILETQPDFVIAGINHGSNLGTDVLYSGTVSAAMEGMLAGVTSIAMSLASYTAKKFDVAANFAVKLLDTLVISPLPHTTLLNVNVPAVSQGEIKGVKIARQGLRRYTEKFEHRFDPRGKSYYWLAAEIIEDIDQPEHMYLPASIPTDVQAIREHYITITPLH